jgi:hypothetical protein
LGELAVRFPGYCQARGKCARRKMRIEVFHS